MDVSRRWFLKGALAVPVAIIAAPAVVRASSLMRVVPRPGYEVFASQNIAYDSATTEALNWKLWAQFKIVNSEWIRRVKVIDADAFIAA